MKLTIIPSDGAVYVNGKFVTDIPLSYVPSSIHALQWDENTGWLEFLDKPNETIAELPDWATQALSDFEQIQNKDETGTHEALVKTLSDIYAVYPVANIQSVNQLLNTQFSNIVLSPRIRESDGNLIGVEIQRVSGEVTGTGSTALFSIRAATELSVSLGVPLISNAVVSLDKEEGFKKYLLSLGHEVVQNNHTLYLYFPWSLQMAKARKRQIINSEREFEIKQGITYLGENWDIDSTSKANLLSKLITLGDTPMIEWRTKGNNMVTLSASEFTGLVNKVVEATEKIYKKSWDRKDTVTNASTYEEIEAA